MNPELLERIESAETATRVNVVSGYKQFIRTISSLPETVELLGQVQAAEDVTELLCRVVDLANTPHEEAYENPNDVALSIYLWVLSFCEPTAAYAVASVVRACRGCLWAWKLAAAVVEGNRTSPAQYVATTIVDQGTAVRAEAWHSSDVESLVLICDAGVPGRMGTAITSSQRAHFRSFPTLLAERNQRPRNRGAATLEIQSARRNAGTANRISERSFEAAT
jgi:hypothetical protein